MGGLTWAWLAAEGAVCWRLVRRDKHAPVPAELLGITALYGILALGHEAAPIAGLTTALGWGLAVAAALDILPQGFGGQLSTVEKTEPSVAGPDKAVA